MDPLLRKGLLSCFGPAAVEAMELREAGHSFRQIAKIQGVSLSTAWARVEKAKDSENRCRKSRVKRESTYLKLEKDRLLACLLANGLDFLEVSKITGVSVEAIKAFDESFE